MRRPGGGTKISKELWDSGPSDASVDEVLHVHPAHNKMKLFHDLQAVCSLCAVCWLLRRSVQPPTDSTALALACAESLPIFDYEPTQ